MKTISSKLVRLVAYSASLTLLTGAGVLFAQDPPATGTPQQSQTPPSSGWRKVGTPPSNDPQGQQPPASSQPPEDQQNYTIPPQLTIKPGTFVTVRMNQWLSSDRNQAGDAFSATLARPIVVDGVVVAERGQTVAGRVTEATKAGHVKGVSRLGVQLTDLTLVDGQQVPIQSQLLTRSGDTSVGRDAVGVGGTTALGAAIGAGVNGGVGAGVGAGAGALVGVLGVLLTRGHATVIYPESVLTFRVEAPVTFSTDRAPQAFRFVEPEDYERPYDTQLQTRPGPPSPPPSLYGPSYYPYPYYYPYYPYYWGPGFSFFYGPRFYGYGLYGGGFYGRGFYGGGFRGGGFHGGGHRGRR